MQSLYRALRRGNAVAYLGSAVTGVQIRYKKGSTKSEWHYARRHSVTHEFLLRFAPKK